MEIKTYYDILQVREDADIEVIKGAYRFLAQKYHPDKYPDKEAAEKILKVINKAYSVLSDPVKRAEYDAFLWQQREFEKADNTWQRAAGSGIIMQKIPKIHGQNLNASQNKIRKKVLL
ncbi:MAG: DnaJ domain-containing protein [Cardiobacterium sp.]